MHGLRYPAMTKIERRTDNDGVSAALELVRMLRRGEAVGLLFGVLKTDGRFELGASGILYDNPLLAGGLTGQLQAMTDSWREHPSTFLPDPE